MYRQLRATVIVCSLLVAAAPRSGMVSEAAVSGFGTTAALSFLAGTRNPAAATGIRASQYRQWGEETLQAIEKALWLPGRSLYADEITVGKPTPDKPAFMWGCGVQLSALAAAARIEPDKYRPSLRAYADALQVYWTQHNGVGGFDVLPGPKPPDRYYDDNVWIALALAETFEATGDTKYRDRAEATFRFVLSGEDNKLAGGIYWRESDRASKNTCSNAPSIASALRLYQVTGKREYLGVARRLYEWTNIHLQDSDGLYWDNVKLDGVIEKTKWSYNSALMIRSNCLFYSITHTKKYLDEAQRIARAAEAKWVHSDTGAIADGGAFAHHLSESFLALYEQDHDRHWVDVVSRALLFLHEKVRDPAGHYGSHWDAPQATSISTLHLLDQASAARAYWMAARLLPA